MFKEHWLKILARIGYAAKGVLFIVVGLVSLLTALGFNNKLDGMREALKTIIRQPFGQILLAVLAAGLLAHAVWRLAQAVLDPQEKGKKTAAVIERLGFFSSVIIYAGLAYAAFKHIFFSVSDSGGGAEQYTATALRLPFGEVIVMIAGIIIIGSGLFQGYLAYSGNFKEKFNLENMSSVEIKWATRISSYGLASRSVVFVMLGVFLIRAAAESNSKYAGELDKAFYEILTQPFGSYLLGIVAAGFIAYGFFTLVLSRYHKFYGRADSKISL